MKKHIMRFSFVLMMVAVISCGKSDSENKENNVTNDSQNSIGANQVRNVKGSQNPIQVSWENATSSGATFQVEYCLTNGVCKPYLTLRCSQNPCSVLDTASMKERANLEYHHSVNNNLENFSIKDLAFDVFSSNFKNVRVRMNDGPWAQN